MKTIDREEFKTNLKTDVDAYGKPKRLMTKIDVLFDSYEALQAEIEDLKKLILRKRYKELANEIQRSHGTDCKCTLCGYKLTPPTPPLPRIINEDKF